MRRQDIQLLASARQGNLAARCEVGRRYLAGTGGFPRHPATGLEYLTHPSVAASEQAARIVAEAMPLHEIVRLDQMHALRTAAKAGLPCACVKLALWACLRGRDASAAKDWLQAAADAGDAAAAAALAAIGERSATQALHGVLCALFGYPGIDAVALLPLAISQALDDDDGALVACALDSLLTLQRGCAPELADCVCKVLEQAQRLPQFRLRSCSERVEQLLESCLVRGSADAALLLGRAYCGIDSGPLAAASLVGGQNVRKGAALLLRAADSGRDEAWMHLYRVHADNRASVANQQMARFFLEKAATRGHTAAQRRLGALTLRSASTLHESEQGIRWLHEAASRGDAHAVRLLRSLVLPVGGQEAEAAVLIDAIRRDDPWMACRLRTARDFGLTKLEALSVDIVAGYRTWGLVVGTNPFIMQARLSAPRAVPALTAQALERLRRSAAFLEQARQDGAPFEGDLRKRSVRLRHLLDRHGGDEPMFFADASSTTLQSLRLGSKWAFHARQPLRSALAA